MKKQLSKFPVLGLLFAAAGLATMSASFAEGSHKSGHGEAHWMAPTKAAKKVNPIKSDTVSINRGKVSYFNLCSSCHGANAMGDGPAGAALNPRPANLNVMSGMHGDGDFAWKIANGRGAMPAWKTTLNENQIWDLVNYIQNLKGDGQMPMKEMDHSKMGHSNADEHHKPEPESHSNNNEHAH